MLCREYTKLMQSLNEKQQEFSTHIMYAVATSTGQIAVCLHGVAESRKSHVLKELCKGLYRIYPPSGTNVDDCNI